MTNATVTNATVTKAGQPLRIAFLVYRGNPYCGGQGVYTRHITRELTELGHTVTVFSGQPYPDLVPGVELVKIPSLDLYREPEPFRIPRRREIESLTDLIELATMCVGGFPEPRTFSLRVARALKVRRGQFDLVHDNQCLGPGVLQILAGGLPVIASIHHPVTVDRAVELDHAGGVIRRAQLRRWYAFTAMQTRVARRLPAVMTVSESSRRDIVTQLGVSDDRIAVVPVGVDPTLHRPMPHVARVPGRIMTTASADVAMKGLIPLLEALAKVRTDHVDAHLVVVGKVREDSPVGRVLGQLELGDAVEFVSGESDERLVERYAESTIAVVPSLYEGFSLPAIEAMACGVPLVATSGGALPEVVGTSGETALVVPPGDPEALAHAIRALLDNPELRERIAEAGRERVLARFTWSVAAMRTVERYRALLAC